MPESSFNDAQAYWKPSRSPALSANALVLRCSVLTQRREGCLPHRPSRVDSWSAAFS